MAKFDHERAHMAANLVSDPPVEGAISFTFGVRPQPVGFPGYTFD